jgi:hypothetical protein
MDFHMLILQNIDTDPENEATSSEILICTY